MGLVDWLLEEESPSARYRALRHVLDQPEQDPQLASARAAILSHPPARTILEAQWPTGCAATWGRALATRPLSGK
jgi:hypothetical protein